MKTIWKFEMSQGDMPHPVCQLDMPAGAKVVRVARQGAAICLWAIVESDNALQPRLFATVGTGRPIPLDVRYLGTWDDGPFVWHLFEPASVSDTEGEPK
jgi:hypothetical protein